MRDAPDSPRAQELRREVELCTTLLNASSGSDDALTQREVDLLLGVDPPAARK